MIIDIPFGDAVNANAAAAVTETIRAAALELGFRADTGPSRVARSRSHGPVLRVEGVRLFPSGTDSYRAHSPADYDTDQGVSPRGTGVGRKKNAICYHGYREWMRAIFRTYPAAVFRTSVQTWDGAADFEVCYRDHEAGRWEACLCVAAHVDGATEPYDSAHLDRLGLAAL